ncbi:MAG: hypothetical protein AB7G25_16060 [Sphingomonadaceae bacterium]
MARRFTRFAVADWSGAKGSRHPGIAIAECGEGDQAPALVPPPARHWSRSAVLEWLSGRTDDLLIGFDFSFAPPFLARGAYLPGDETAEDAVAFHAYVDRRCTDEDLGAASFLERHHRRHFYLGAADGRKSDFMHLRACEAHYNASGGGKPSTVYDAIGAAQVAKASFAGMRLLHRLREAGIAIWPFDPIPKRGPLVVEIYAQIAARAAGLRKGLSKIRDADSLDAALAAFGSRPHAPLARYTDHATDAILTAAWLRAHAGHAALWMPPALTTDMERTEGWTFGVV